VAMGLIWGCVTLVGRSRGWGRSPVVVGGSGRPSLAGKVVGKALSLPAIVQQQSRVHGLFGWLTGGFSGCPMFYFFFLILTVVSLSPISKTSLKL